MASDPKAGGPPPLETPPPPPVPPGLGSLNGRADAVDGQGDKEKSKPSRECDHVVVGEIRQNLDDLKAAVLSYYSRLYSNTGRSIEERLDRLAAAPFSNSIREGRLPLATQARRNPRGRRAGLEPPPPNTCFDFLAEDGKDSKDAKASSAPAAQGDPEAQKSFYGMTQLPGQKANPGMKGYDNYLGRDLEETRSGYISEMLSELRRKCTAASKRLNTIGDQLERECENPDLREWEYATYPEVRRHPHLGREPQLRHHLLTLYKDLEHQARTNQQRINAIQSKLRVLNLHTKSDMIKLKSDPRIAF
ncbi:hypothetical protein Efla_007158 [Eimeria flavescens]